MQRAIPGCPGLWMRYPAAAREGHLYTISPDEHSVGSPTTCLEREGVVNRVVARFSDGRVTRGRQQASRPPGTRSTSPRRPNRHARYLTAGSLPEIVGR